MLFKSLCVFLLSLVYKSEPKLALHAPDHALTSHTVHMYMTLCISVAKV